MARHRPLVKGRTGLACSVLTTKAFTPQQTSFLTKSALSRVCLLFAGGYVSLDTYDDA